MTRRTPARSGSARRRAASSSASNQTPMILVGVGVVVVIAIFVISGGGNEDDTKGKKGKADKGGAKAASTNTGTENTNSAPPPSGIQAQPGSTPRVAAPTIDRRWFGTVDAAFNQAKDVSNEGKKAQQAGDPGKMQAKFKEAKRILREGMETIPQAVWDWDDEAQIEGWARPAEYVELSRWYSKWSKLEQQLHRLGR